MTWARGSWVPGATLPSRERAVPKLLGPSTALSSSSNQGRREGKYLGWAERLRSWKLKVKPVIKLPDAGVLPDLSCSGPGTVRGCFGSASALPQGRWQRCPAYGQLSSRSRSPRREFKCQRCRKPAGGGSPRVLARTARPAGPCKEKLSRAQPCLWAGAPLETRGRCLGREGC